MTAAPTARAMPILCCSAGGVPIGICAEEVSEFSATRADAPHLAALLGLTAPPLPDADPTAVSSLRTLRLRSGGAEALVSVDGPVHVRTLGADQLLAVPRLLKSASSALIGFHAVEGKLVVLVDVAAVLRLATASAGVAGAGGDERC
jgi:hypothetical protein